MQILPDILDIDSEIVYLLEARNFLLNTLSRKPDYQDS
jgi:hypothetical protein